MTSTTTQKKNTQKLQRAIVDGLEDVKAQDIQVFNTEHLSALFERVIIAAGTSNRQTRALAASVRDAVRDAGFAKPRIEGEENGEWIIVDCGAAVAHIMQPAIRKYYNLEELWGDTPVQMKFGAPKPAKATDSEEKQPKVRVRRSSSATKNVVEDQPPARVPAKAAAKKSPRRAAGPQDDAATAAVKKPVRKAAAKTTAAAPIKTVVVKPPKSAARKPATPAKKAVARKAPAKKTPASPS